MSRLSNCTQSCFLIIIMIIIQHFAPNAVHLTQLVVCTLWSSVKCVDGQSLVCLSVLGLHSSSLRVHLIFLRRKICYTHYHFKVAMSGMISVTPVLCSSSRNLSVGVNPHIDLSIRVYVTTSLFGVAYVSLCSECQNQRHALIQSRSPYTKGDIAFKYILQCPIWYPSQSSSSSHFTGLIFTANLDLMTDMCIFRQVHILHLKFLDCRQLPDLS